MREIFKNFLVKSFFCLLLIVGLIFGLNFLFSSSRPSRRFLSDIKVVPGIRVVRAGNSQNIAGWVWSETVGWISFNSNGCDANADGKSEGSPDGCPPAGSTTADYGVNIEQSNGRLSGQGWSENVGWLSFNRGETGVPPSDDPCPSGGCIAKVVPVGQFLKSDVNVEGWARALAACDSAPCSSSGPGTNSGGWDGWVRFDHNQTGETIFSGDGQFHNWAWDDDKIGWLSMNSAEGGGLINYAAGYNCICPAWSYPGCGANPCAAACGAGGCAVTEVPRTRTCTPSGCGEDGDECFGASVCWHKECNKSSKKCENIAGPGNNQCSTDDSCLLGWQNWKWWEIVPKLDK